jgi:uroporphyrinogen-III decarboxylase
MVACLLGIVPIFLLCGGTPDVVRDFFKIVIETAGKGGGYILSTGAGLQGTKPENLKALIDAGREFGVYN